MSTERPKPGLRYVLELSTEKSYSRHIFSSKEAMEAWYMDRIVYDKTPYKISKSLRPLWKLDFIIQKLE